MITFEQIRAVGGIVHSDGNILFKDISMLHALEAPSAYNSAGPIKRYMLDCNIDGMDQFREFILATDHDTLVHDVLANADPAGTVQENGLLRDQVRQLDAMVGRMKREAAAPQAPEQ